MFFLAHELKKPVHEIETWPNREIAEWQAWFSAKWATESMNSKMQKRSR